MSINYKRRRRLLRCEQFFLNLFYSCGFKVDSLEMYIIFFSHRKGVFRQLYQSRVHIMLINTRIIYRGGKPRNIFQDLGNVKKKEETEI